MPRPTKGLDVKIDKICDKVDGYKEDLKDFLAKAREQFGCNTIVYQHNRKYQYQLESPADCCAKFDENRLDNLDFPHSFVVVGKVRGGRRRYVCDYLLELSRKITDAERLYKKRMVPLIRDMFLRFYSYREHWTNAVNIIAELDVLCALATFSK